MPKFKFSQFCSISKNKTIIFLKNLGSSFDIEICHVSTELQTVLSSCPTLPKPHVSVAHRCPVKANRLAL